MSASPLNRDVLGSLDRCAYLLRRVSDGDHKALENARAASDEAAALLAEVRGSKPEWDTDDTGEPDGQHIIVEYDLAYTGGNYFGVGQTVKVPADRVAAMGVQAAFKEVTGADPVHIVHYSGEVYDDADAATEGAADADHYACFGGESGPAG